MFKNSFTLARKFGSKALAGTALAIGSASAFAQSDPFTAVFSAMELAGISVAVAAAGILIVVIALTEKAPTVAKRTIRKV